jgi:hypothetical protein
VSIVDAAPLNTNMRRFTAQQLAPVAVRTGLTGKDNRSDRYGEDQMVGTRIKITIMLSWRRTASFTSKPAKR